MKLKTQSRVTRLRSIQVAAFSSLSALCLFGFGSQAKANLVQNGQFLSTSLSSPGGYVCAVGTTCASQVTDWGSLCNAGTCGGGGTVLSLLFAGTGGVAFNGGNALNVDLPDSPGGGNIIGGDGDPTYHAPLFQTISGLKVGATYDLTFYQAAAQQGGFASPTTEQWEVTFGGDVKDSTVMSTPGGAFSPWNLQSLSFVANSTTELLNFLALGTPSGAPPVALLADVSLAPVPEPASLALLGVGFVGVVGIARLRRAKRSQAAAVDLAG